MITTINIANVKGLAMQEIKLAPGINYLFGDYGTGKSSLVRALEWAVVGTSDAKPLLRLNEKYMDVSIAMTDGIVIESNYTKNAMASVSVTIKGGKTSRPREWLRTNIAPYFLSNVGYDAFSADKKYEAFMATVPTISEARVMAIVPKELHEHINGIDYTKPSPVVIKKIINILNALKKKYAGILSDMKSVLSTDVRNINEFEYDIEIIRLKEELDKLQPFYMAVPDDVEAEIKKYEDERLLLQKRLDETNQALLNKKEYVLRGEVDYCPVGLQCPYSADEIKEASKKMLKKSEIVRSLESVKDGIEHDMVVNKKNTDMLKNMLDEGITSKKLYDDLYNSFKSKKEKMEYELKLYRQSQSAIEKMSTYEELSDSIGATITKLREEIKDIDVSPDIDNVSVKGKTVYFNGIPLVESCGTEQLITIAKLAKKLNNGHIFIVDDADLLTEQSFNELKTILEGWQLLFLMHSSDKKIRVEQSDGYIRS